MSFDHNSLKILTCELQQLQAKQKMKKRARKLRSLERKEAKKQGREGEIPKASVPGGKGTQAQSSTKDSSNLLRVILPHPPSRI